MSVVELPEKENFSTGSIRNSRAGKGRYDLIACLDYSCLPATLDATVTPTTPIEKAALICFLYLSNYLASQLTEYLEMACSRLAQAIDETDGFALSWLNRLAKHYEAGACIYADRNWEKGQYLTRYIDSAMRHCVNILQKEITEDHAAAVLWNILAIGHTLEMIKLGLLDKTLDDRPNYTPQERQIP